MENPGKPHPWTDERIPLKEFVMMLVSERDMRYEQKFHSMNVAVGKADEATRTHFELINGLQRKSDEERRDFATKEDVDRRFMALESKLDLAVATQQLASGRSAGINASWVVFVGVASLLMGVVGTILALKRS